MTVLIAASRNDCDTFRRWLTKQGTPFVAVDEARRALFAEVDLGALDFIVYQPDGPNLLVTLEALSDDVHDDMRRWSEVFGVGDWEPVRACQVDDRWEYRPITG